MNDKIVTVEEINGRKCTVVRKPFDAEWVKEQLAVYETPVTFSLTGNDNIYFTPLDCFGDSDKSLEEYLKYWSNLIDLTVVTILPPLPRNPKPEDAPLLYRYMAEGLDLTGYHVKHEPNINLKRVFLGLLEIGFTITHATVNGERVEIAIEKV